MKDQILFSGLTQICDKTTVENYVPTERDAVKEKTNRLVSICGKFYTVILTSGEQLSITGKRAWNKWAKANDYVTDF